MSGTEIVELAPDPVVIDLLRRSDLPVDDLATPPPGPQLFGIRSVNGDPITVIGLEPAGADALLRSLAVEPAWRGRGLAGRLLVHAEARAAAHGHRALHLLTESAVAYFAARDYKYGERGRAPAAVRAKPQFRTLCPDTAQYMTKNLAGRTRA